MMLIGLDKSGQKSDIYHTARQERRKPKGEIQMKNKKYYIAYGSNLSVEQMAHRCPDARIAGQAVLAGWELLFRGCATIAPNPKKNTPVLVWEISERDEGNLDLYEGYPNYYRKEDLNIELLRERAEPEMVTAMVYIMENDFGRRAPSLHYYKVLHDGYKTFKFPMHILEGALKECMDKDAAQKMIEEAPSAALSPELRQRMGETAVRAAKAAGYVNAGTIEFLLEKDGSFYFMEMNTRIQVEHPITEWITGIDLIKEQIRIADGKRLSYTQDQVKISGHAIEVRINAERPEENFLPCPGTITGLHLPGGKGVRIDSAIYSGYTIPPYYDSMIAKISVWAKNRREAIQKMQSALGEVIIEGVDTNVNYQYALLNHPDFLAGNIDIEFIDRIQQEA